MTLLKVIRLPVFNPELPSMTCLTLMYALYAEQARMNSSQETEAALRGKFQYAFIFRVC